MWRLKRRPLGRRQQRIRDLSRQGWPAWATIAGFLALIWGAVAWYGISETRKASASDNLPDIALEEKSDFIYDMARLQSGQSRFFTYPASSSERTRVLVQRDSNGVIRTAFAFCTACYSQSHESKLSQGSLICGHCQDAMRLGDPNERITADKGCVAVPIPFSVENNEIKVEAQAITGGLKNFAKPQDNMVQSGDTSKDPNVVP